MQISVEHNLSDEDLKKALAGLAIGSGIENELLETLQKAVCACDSDIPKTPKHRATRFLYQMMQLEYTLAAKDIERYAWMISKGELQKSVSPTPLTADQLRQLQQAIVDRFGFIAGQIQSVDYQPAPDLLERWKKLGLVSQEATPATFMASVPAEMHFIRNAFLMGKLVEAVEAGKTYQEVMALALHAPILAPDLHAIAVAEEQCALYLRDNAADLATKVGQIAIKQRTETIRQMAVDYHGRKLKRTVLDETAKREAGEEIPERFVDGWREFKSELHQACEDKARDLSRVAFFEIENSKMIGQGHKLLEDIGPDGLVYKRTMPTACQECLHAYNIPGTNTPKLFKLSTLLMNNSNIGRKPNPKRGGKVVPGGRPDGAETMKPVLGLHHPWCQCQLFQYFGFEPWSSYYKENQEQP